MHWDADSAFKHSDTEARWDISDTLEYSFCCSMHLPVTGTCLLCHQRPSATLPEVATAHPLTATGERMEQAVNLLYCSSPLRWTRKRAGRLGTSRTAEEDGGIAYSFTLFLAKALLLLELQHSLWYEVSALAQLPAAAWRVKEHLYPF